MGFITSDLRNLTQKKVDAFNPAFESFIDKNCSFVGESPGNGMGYVSGALGNSHGVGKNLPGFKVVPFDEFL